MSLSNHSSIATQPIVLALSDIHLSFGGVQVLKQLDLQVQAGSITAIIGPNGAGKSSLLNIINGIYQAQQGQIHLFGQLQHQLSPRKAAQQGVARTFQNLALFKSLSVIDNIRAGRQLQEKSHWLSQLIGLASAKKEQVKETEQIEIILALLHLQAWRDVPVGTLAYGLQKRVELARALAAQPKLLLLDEPMAGMNHDEKQQLSSYIKSVQEEFGTSIVLIEHDIKVVMALADHLVVLDYGKKIADGDPAEVRHNPEVLAVYLGLKQEKPSKQALSQAFHQAADQQLTPLITRSDPAVAERHSAGASIT